MADSKTTIQKYLQATKYIALATVNEEKAPVIRTLGGFVLDDLQIYFSTGKSTDKVKQIRLNPKVALLFQHENQEIKSFINITLSGTAYEVTENAERSKAIALLAAKSPKFKERAKNGELSDRVFFRIDPEQIKVVDLSKGSGAKSVETIKVVNSNDSAVLDYSWGVVPEA